LEPLRRNETLGAGSTWSPPEKVRAPRLPVRQAGWRQAGTWSPPEKKYRLYLLTLQEEAIPACQLGRMNSTIQNVQRVEKDWLKNSAE